MHKPVAIFSTAAIFILGWLYWQQSHFPPFIVSGFIEADQIRVGSRVGGRVADVFVEEGDRIHPNELLYRLEPFDLDATLAQAKSELAASMAEHERLQSGFRKEELEQAHARLQRVRATLDKAIAGPRTQEIAVAKEHVKIAHAGLELAEAELSRLGALVKKSQVSEEAYDNTVRERKAAAAELAAAEQNLSLMLEGTRKEDLAAVRADFSGAEQALALLKGGYRREEVAKAAAQMAAAEAKLEAIQARVNELEVKSPCDCVVEAIELRPGDLVPANAPAVSLLDLNRLWVRTYIPEARLSNVNLGLQVPIRVDGLEEMKFPGRITFIAQEGEFTPRNIQTPEERSKQVFRAKVTLQEGFERLRVGMAADVLFNEAMRP